MRCLSIGVLLLLSSMSSVGAAEKTTYLLAAELNAGDTSLVSVQLDVGGDMVVDETGGKKHLPLTVKGELDYVEQLVSWSADSAEPTRSLREYQNASAKIQIDDGGVARELPKSQRLIVAEIRHGRAVLNGNESALTREDCDLVNAAGNSLPLNR